ASEAAHRSWAPGKGVRCARSGSIPVLSALTLLSRSTTVVRLAVTQTDAGSSPAGTARFGRASQQARWHPVGSRARRKPLQVRVLSLPLSDKDVLPGEQSSSNLDAEGSTPFVLARVSVAEQPRDRPAASDRRVRLPPDTLTPCEEAGVHRPGCLPGKTGSIPVQGASSGRGLSGEATT